MRRNIHFDNDNGRNYLVLWRDTVDSETEKCPFCDVRHKHGISDGHKVAHCDVRSHRFLEKVFVPEDNVALFHKDGYIVKTRK